MGQAGIVEGDKTSIRAPIGPRLPMIDILVCFLLK